MLSPRIPKCSSNATQHLKSWNKENSRGKSDISKGWMCGFPLIKKGIPNAP